MAQIMVRLLKEWENGGTTWPEGQLLKMEERDSEPLIKSEILEAYVAAADDVVAPSPAGGNMSGDDIEAIFLKLLEEREKKTAARLPIITGRDEQLAKTGGFQNVADFGQHVAMAETSVGMSQTLRTYTSFIKATGMSEGVPVDGGHLVPTEFRNELLRNRLEASIVRSRAREIPMATNSVKIPVVDETTHASSVFGGVIIYKPAEAAAKTASQPKLGQIELNLKKLIGLVYVTDELLQDSPITLQPLLTTMFSEAIAWQEDEDFINGTGAGEALGVIKAPCLVSVPKETGQVAATIVLDNVLKMWSRMYPRSHGSAVWMANSDTFPQVAKLAIAVGTGGSAAGLIGSDATGAPSSTILGRPLILTEHCQTVGTKGDILLADWNQYIIGNKVGQGLKVDTSIHLKFNYDETAFRFVMRYDGMPWWKSALTPKHGSNTLSPFVTLAARA